MSAAPWERGLLDAEATMSGDHTIPGIHGRHAVHKHDLLRLLTEQIRQHPGCEAVSVIEVMRLEPADSDGCNWSSTLVLEPAGVAPEVYVLAYGEIIANARQTWNLR